MQKIADSLRKNLNIPDVEYECIVQKLGRAPNETEVFIFSAMWSEHCGYKHSKKYLELLPRQGGAFSDENAGGIKIGEHYIFFKAESHNHPSAVEPYQGAATGIGGIVRDIMALGARPIALMDSLKFSTLTSKKSKYLFNGVVSGISDYGNSIGVPAVGGEVIFDDSYADSPLVNVFAAGIVHKDNIMLSAAQENCDIVLIGSFTGRDGIHGASFASKELCSESHNDRPSVQIGDPFVKKLLIEAVLEIARVKGVIACQDCGAAGILSSTSEMVYKGNCGVDLHLDKVHLRESGMNPWEILLSESQERMVFAIKPESVSKVAEICKKIGIECSTIGYTSKGNDYRVFMQGVEFANLPVSVLNEPYLYDLQVKEPECALVADIKQNFDICDAVKKMVSELNTVSKEWVYSQYDYMVGNRSITNPSQGVAGMWVYEENCAIGFTFDSLPRQVCLNPYVGAQNSIWLSFRKLVSKGYTPKGLTNCLNYGNPQKPEVAYQFVRSIEGIAQACQSTNVPVVSGNVSFYNESESARVYPTPTIGMIGVAQDLNSIIGNSVKENDTVFLIGKNISENSPVGGSLYQKTLFDFLGGEVDNTDAELEFQLQKTIMDLNSQKTLNSCTAISQGGVFCALFKSLLGNMVGFDGSLIFIKDELKALFAEITGRYLLSTANPAQVIDYLEQNNIQFKILGTCVGDKINFDSYSFDLKELSEVYFKQLEIEMSK